MSSGGEFEGCVDRVEDGWVLGWAWEPRKPNEPIDIQVLIDGTPAVRSRAGLYRPDLERAGKGNGGHAFEIRLPEPLDVSVPHEVRVVHAASGADFGGSPATTRAAGRTTPGLEPTANSIGYHSRFGGLWTDLPNAVDVIAGKHALGWISSAEHDLLKEWIINGFVILPHAVPHDLIDRLDGEVERIWDGDSGHRIFVEFWENGEKTIQPAGLRFRDRRVKLLDLFAHSESARHIIFSPPIVRFLTLFSNDRRWHSRVCISDGDRGRTSTRTLRSSKCHPRSSSLRAGLPSKTSGLIPVNWSTTSAATSWTTISSTAV
jgi:hypothetical protein